MQKQSFPLARITILLLIAILGIQQIQAQTVELLVASLEGEPADPDNTAPFVVESYSLEYRLPGGTWAEIPNSRITFNPSEITTFSWTSGPPTGSWSSVVLRSPVLRLYEVAFQNLPDQYEYRISPISAINNWHGQIRKGAGTWEFHADASLAPGNVIYTPSGPPILNGFTITKGAFNSTHRMYAVDLNISAAAGSGRTLNYFYANTSPSGVSYWTGTNLSGNSYNGTVTTDDWYIGASPTWADGTPYQGGAWWMDYGLPPGTHWVQLFVLDDLNAASNVLWAQVTLNTPPTITSTNGATAITLAANETYNFITEDQDSNLTETRIIHKSPSNPTGTTYTETFSDRLSNSMSQTITFSESGTHTIEFQGIDAIGEASAISSITVNVAPGCSDMNTTKWQKYNHTGGELILEYLADGRPNTAQTNSIHSKTGLTVYRDDGNGSFSQFSDTALGDINVYYGATTAGPDVHVRYEYDGNAFNPLTASRDESRVHTYNMGIQPVGDYWLPHGCFSSTVMIYAEVSVVPGATSVNTNNPPNITNVTVEPMPGHSGPNGIVLAECGLYKVTVTATDDTGINQIQIRNGATLLGSHTVSPTSTSVTYTFENLVAPAAGPAAITHTITAQVRDTNSATDTDTGTIKVVGPPPNVGWQRYVYAYTDYQISGPDKNRPNSNIISPGMVEFDPEPVINKYNFKSPGGVDYYIDSNGNWVAGTDAPPLTTPIRVEVLMGGNIGESYWLIGTATRVEELRAYTCNPPEPIILETDPIITSFEPSGAGLQYHSTNAGGQRSYSIPIGSALTLTATAEDADGDLMQIVIYMGSSNTPTGEWTWLWDVDESSGYAEGYTSTYSGNPDFQATDSGWYRMVQNSTTQGWVNALGVGSYFIGASATDIRNAKGETGGPGSVQGIWVNVYDNRPYVPQFNIRGAGGDTGNRLFDSSGNAITTHPVDLCTASYLKTTFKSPYDFLPQITDSEGRIYDYRLQIYNSTGALTAVLRDFSSFSETGNLTPNFSSRKFEDMFSDGGRIYITLTVRDYYHANYVTNNPRDTVIQFGNGISNATVGVDFGYGVDLNVNHVPTITITAD